MKDLEYWDECISEILEEAGISASKEQIAMVADAVDGAALVLQDYIGAPARDDDPVGKKIAELEKALAAEKQKRGCPDCNGRGFFIEYVAGREITVTCDRCHGEGKI